MNKIDYGSFLNKDLIRYIPVKILPALSGLMTIFFLTRFLPLKLYSDYTFLAASILLFIQLIAGWSNSSIIFFFNDFKDNRSLEHFKLNVIFFQLIIFILGTFGFMIVVYLGIKNYKLVTICLLLMFFQIILGLFYSFLQAEREIILQVKSTIIQSSIQFFGIIICFYYKIENLINIFLVISSSYFISILFLFFTYHFKKDVNYFKIRSIIDFKIAKKLFKYGLPVCIWFFATQFYAIGDRILLKYFNINDLVGNYASFRDLSVGLSGFITMPLLMASHPIIMKMWKENVNIFEIELLLAKNIKLLITFFSIVFIGLFLVGDWVLSYIVGEKYLLDNNLMFFVLVSIFLGTVSIYLHKGLEVTGKTILMTKIALFVSICSFLLNYFLLPIYGVRAACIISLLSQFFYSILTYFFSKKIFKIKISYLFIFKNFGLVLLVFFLNYFLFKLNINNLARLFLFLMFSSYLFIISNEIKETFKIYKF